mgnify:CR=1 FL=1
MARLILLMETKTPTSSKTNRLPLCWCVYKHAHKPNSKTIDDVITFMGHRREYEIEKKITKANKKLANGPPKTIKTL